jgi:hypothetical protein
VVRGFVINRGNLDAMVSVDRLPDWAHLSSATSLHHQIAVVLEAYWKPEDMSREI